MKLFEKKAAPPEYVSKALKSKPWPKRPKS